MNKSLFLLLLFWQSAVFSADNDVVYSADSSGVETKPWQINGFLSQGMIDADSSLVSTEGKRTWDIREFTLNAQYRPTSTLGFAVQGQYREVGDLAPANGIELDHLLVDWRFWIQDFHEVGIRAGRIKNVMGIYNDSRDLPFARPSILLPQSIYSEALRDQYLRLDGGELYGNHYISEGWLSDVGLSWGISAGTADYNDHASENIAGSLANGSDIDSKGSVRFHSKLNLPFSLDLFLSYSELDFDLDLTPENVGLPDDAEATHKTIGAQWRWNRLELTAEYSEVELEINRSLPQALGIMSIASISQGGLSQTNQSYYLQGRYQFNPQWAGFVRYDRFFLDKSDRYGKDVPENVFGFRSGILSYAITKSVGVSWKPTENWLLMLEYHHVTGYGWVPPLFDPVEDVGADKHWSMVAAQVAYRFGW